ncbi:MAG: methyltransferase domain-containing protein [Bacteroidales bacterium]|nr:methyltransferase domain-containing protein [Bacteroidales bacterium]
MSEIENFYNEYSAKQLERGINKRHFTIIDKLKQFGLKDGMSVLEIGCGVGTLTKLLSDENPNGTIVANDISEKNIEIAKNLFKEYDNINFIYGDAVKSDIKIQGKFDFIVMPDVLEHIPIDNHKTLFEKLETLLNTNGYIAINIPNPYYLEWCHVHRKDILQIIDQPIYTDILVSNTYPNNLHIKYLETYSIWIDNHDYQFIVLEKNKTQDFKEIQPPKLSLYQKIMNKLK